MSQSIEQFVSRMARSTTSTKVIVALLLLPMLALIFAHTTFASMATNSRLNYGDAWAYCNTNNPGAWAKGMVWLSNEGDYYSEIVRVGTNANTVVASIRGAVNTCNTRFSGNTDMWAVDVSASVITGLDANSFYRGTVPAYDDFAWSSVGTVINGTINVSGVAPCTGNALITGQSSGTVTVYITRSMRQTRPDGYFYQSGPGTEPVPVNIVRTCPTYSYDLTPTITAPSDGSIIESDRGDVTVSGQVANAGPTVSRDTSWELNELIYAPSTPLASIVNKSGGPSTSDACGYFTGSTSCTLLDSGTTTYSTSGGSHSDTSTIGTLAVGSKVCYALSVNPYNQTTTDWRHSALRCYVIGKNPKVQVTGSDLIVGRGLTSAGLKIVSNVSTSVTTVSGAGAGAYGSWGEYGIIPSGTVVGMGSASAYASPAPSSALCSVSYLTLANVNGATSTCTDAAVGGYSLDSSSPALALLDRFTPTSGAPTLSGSVNISPLASSRVYPVAGNINLIATGVVPNGKWVVIRAPTSTVTISGDIRYAGNGINQLSRIPQVVIIAQNIIIKDNVTNVDAWLVATGTGTNGYVQTCDADGVVEPAEITSDVCNQRLTVNGPVIANRLLMYRTAGSDGGAQTGAPAEVFNLRPDAYLWASGLETGTGRARTVDTTELPPRY